MRYDLHSLFTNKTALLQLPMFLVLFLVVRGLPALMARHDLDLRSRIALGFLSATQLPLVIVIIGAKSGAVSNVTAASLIGAGMVSLLLFPVVALNLRRVKEQTSSKASVEVSLPLKMEVP